MQNPEKGEGFREEVGCDASLEGQEEQRWERRKGSEHSEAAWVSMDLTKLSWVLKLGLYPGMELVFGGLESNAERERALRGCQLRFLHMKGMGEGKRKQGFTGSMMSYLSLRECPRELKMQHISGLLVKGILCLIPSAAAVLFCGAGY